MAAVLLDTTALIDLPRGRRGVARLEGLHSAGDRPHACAINVEEIERGLRGHREAEAARLPFDGLEMAALDRSEGRQAGMWRRSFASRGVTLAQADCRIAAAAPAIGGRLATGNRADFSLSELDVEHWPVGE